MNTNIKSANSIIIMNLLYMGDLIFSTPFIRNLRQNNPQAQIDIVVNATFRDIIINNPHLDNVYAYDKNFSLKESWQFAKKLAEENYDVGINIHGNWRTAILLKLINANFNVGFGRKGTGIFLDKEFKQAKNIHMVDVYLSFLKELGLQVYEKNLQLEVSNKARLSINRFLQEQGLNESQKLVCLNVGGSWPTKQWTKKGFAKLADIIQNKFKIKVIFTGSGMDLKRVKSIVSNMETEPIIATGKTSLQELTALAEQCAVFISGDSGPVHVAAAVGTPTLTIFGPSDEIKYRPYQKATGIIVKNEIECRPCGEHKCPLDHHKCIKGIAPEEIMKKLDALKINL